MAGPAPVVAVVAAIATAATTPVIPIPFPGAPETLVDGRCLLCGWSVLAGAAAANVVFFDNVTASSLAVARFSLAAAGSSVWSTPSPGILCRQGLSVAASATIATGVAWVRLL